MLPRLRSSGGGLGERAFPPDLRLNLIRFTEDCESSSRKRFRPAGEIWKRTIRDGLVTAGVGAAEVVAAATAAGPSRPCIAEGVEGPALTGVTANGLTALDPVVATGLGDA